MLSRDDGSSIPIAATISRTASFSSASTSFARRSYVRCQIARSVAVSTTARTSRTRPGGVSTVPRTARSALRSWRSVADKARGPYRAVDVRDNTRIESIVPSRSINASVTPSAKYEGSRRHHRLAAAGRLPSPCGTRGNGAMPFDESAGCRKRATTRCRSPSIVRGGPAGRES